MNFKFGKKNIFIAIIILASFLILFVVIFFIINYPRIKGHFYTGERINVNLKVISNGHEVPLNDLVATGTYDYNNDFDVVSENGVYKALGGEHGHYQFEIVIPKERLSEYDHDLIVQLNYINTNNWYISKKRCVINLDFDENGFTSGNSSVYISYNDRTSSEYKDKIKFNDNIISVDWGL